MRTRRQTKAAMVLTLLVIAGLGLQELSAQLTGTRRRDLLRHDLSVPGREVVQAIVELEPGVTSARHTHPGDEIVFVLDGAPLAYELEGRPTVTLKPGDVLFIPAGTIHAARNVGTRTGAELATYVVEKGRPLLTEVGAAPR